MSDIEKVRRDLGFQIGDALTIEQMKQIIIMQAQGKIKVEHLTQIAAITKSFGTVAVEASKALHQTAASAANVKKAALEALAKSIDVLDGIVKASSDSEVHIKVIDAIREIGERIERMDQKNDTFFGNALKMLGAIGLLAIGAIAGRSNRV